MKNFKKTIKILVFIAILVFLQSFILLEVKAASDTTPPVIRLNGFSFVKLTLGVAYNDLGATATDDVDGDLTADIAIFNPVDTSTPGVYTVTYDVTDSAGNEAEQVNRWVFVQDILAPSAPLALPPTGNYTTNQAVSLFSTDDGAGLDKIYYTTDGKVPSETSTYYAGPITVNKNMTIKAVAIDRAGNYGDVMEATYKIVTKKVVTVEENASTNDDSDDDDDKDKDKDKDRKKDKKDSVSITTITGSGVTTGNDGGTVMGEENNEQVQGDESKTDDELLEEEAAKAEKLSGGISIWRWLWWLLLILLVLLLVYFIFKKRDENKRTSLNNNQKK